MKPLVTQPAWLGIFSGLALLVANMGAAQEVAVPEQLRMMGQCSGCVIEDLDLSGSRLTGINLKESTIRNVDFSNAALGIAIFDSATLENVNFGSANLTGASFSDARLINVTFDNANLKAAVFEDAILEDTDLAAGITCNTQVADETTDSTECN